MLAFFYVMICMFALLSDMCTHPAGYPPGAKRLRRGVFITRIDEGLLLVLDPWLVFHGMQCRGGPGNVCQGHRMRVCTYAVAYVRDARGGSNFNCLYERCRGEVKGLERDELVSGPRKR